MNTSGYSSDAQRRNRRYDDCMRRLMSLLVVLCGCSGEIDSSTIIDGSDPGYEQSDSGPSMLDAGTVAAGQEDAGSGTDAGGIDAGNTDIPGGGFIGSPCDETADCAYDGAICLTDNIDQGLCTLPCDRICPDRDGFAVTFCIDGSEIDSPSEQIPDNGACVSRCDFQLFPETGCRTGFGCAERTRYSEPEKSTYVCLPNIETKLDDCYAELMSLGVNFEPTSIADRSPSNHPNLICRVEDPVIILSPLHDVELAYYDGRVTSRVTASCAMAKALSATLLDVKAFGVTRLLHIGTYNCRVISGTNRLSRHGMGDAIDIYGFDFEDGSRATLIDDWEHDTESPQSMAAQFLYNAAYRWHDAKLWTIILTPNYNVGHDNHFHIDLTPGSDFIQLQGDSYIGPAPYAD